ncbi:MAG: MauE/DoxX family redox-associated membrane protein [Pseudomonadota bacterium]
MPSLAIALGLAFLLGASAFHKLKDMARFIAIVNGYGLVTPLVLPHAAWAIAGAEALLAAALLAPATRAGAGFMAAVLLVAYGAAIAVNLLRGRRQLDCGCHFGRARQGLSGWLLLRNGALAALALTLVLPVSSRPLGWFDIANAFFAAASAGLFYLTIEALPAASRRARPFKGEHHG